MASTGARTSKINGEEVKILARERHFGQGDQANSPSAGGCLRAELGE